MQRSPSLLITVVVAIAAWAGWPSPARATTPPPPAETAAPNEAAGPYGSAFVVRANGSTSTWSTTGTAPTVSRPGPGRFVVRFPGITSSFGAPALTPAPGLAGSTCSLDQVTTQNNAVVIRLHCNRASGQPADAGFALSYTSQPGPYRAWGTVLQASDTYQPVLPSYSAWGPIHAKVVPSERSTGFEIQGPPLFSNHHSIFSSWGPGAGQCTQGHLWPAVDLVLTEAVCSTPSGAWLHRPVSIHHLTAWMFEGVPGITAHSGIVVSGGTASATNTFNNVGQLAAQRTAPGVVVITLKNGATAKAGLVHVNADATPTDNRCNAVATDAGPDEKITVRCFTRAGAPADTNFRWVYFGAY